MLLSRGSRFTEKLKLKRMATKGAYVNGFFLEGVASEIEFYGSVQALSPEEVLQLPEGYRTKLVYQIFTETEIHADSDDLQTQADIVTIGGHCFRVISVERVRYVRPHYVATVSKVNA
jgi:hypothetical protein